MPMSCHTSIWRMICQYSGPSVLSFYTGLLTLRLSWCHCDLKMRDTGMTYLDPSWPGLPYPLME